jgi:Holliday junction resolvase RusA-like endonuclease
MDIDNVRKHAEDYVAKSLRIMNDSGSVEVSEEQRREMVKATMRVAGVVAAEEVES